MCREIAADELPEKSPEGETSHWACLLRQLSSISGLMTATTKSGDCHESRSHSMADACSEASATIQLVQIKVLSIHPLLY
jgi:hypothetical protein